MITHRACAQKEQRSESSLKLIHSKFAIKKMWNFSKKNHYSNSIALKFLFNIIYVASVAEYRNFIDPQVWKTKFNLNLCWFCYDVDAFIPDSIIFGNYSKANTKIPCKSAKTISLTKCVQYIRKATPYTAYTWSAWKMKLIFWLRGGGLRVMFAKHARLRKFVLIDGMR